MKFLSILTFALICLSGFSASDSVMYPACFQKNAWNICENMPGVLGFYPLNEPPSTKAVLHLEIPAFLKYRFSGFSSGKKVDPVEQRSIVRNGMPYTRIDITLSESFRTNWKQFRNAASFPFYLKEFILLDAEKNTAGKSAPLYWKMTTDRGTSPEKSLMVKVLPPTVMPARPSQKFMIGFSGIESVSGKFDSYAADLCKFLKGLTVCEIYANLGYDYPVPDAQFASAKESGSVCFFPNFRPDPLEREIRLGKWNHKYPVTKDHHNYYGLSLSYMVDDPEGFFAQYLKDGILRFRKNAPQAKYLRWDYEPLASQYSSYDLEVFSKKYLKRQDVLPYEEIQKNYPKQWSNFMYEQSARLVRKYSEAVRRNWPGIKLMMVSGFMDRKYPENKYRSIYTPLDVRETEHLFDVHSPMIYWQGTDFYDDVELNLRYLKKPFIPWIDPSEHRDVFYLRYTPEGVRQNILASAALGAKGIVIYPTASLDGAYFSKITDAFSQIVNAEDALDGKKITAQCKVAVANVVRMELADSAGKTASVVMPEYDAKIRYCIRQKGNRFAVALFNYNKDTVFLRLNIPGFTENGLVKLQPDGAVILTELPEQAALEKELTAEIQTLQENLKFEKVRFGGSTVAWSALDDHAYPALLSGRCTLTIDPKLAVPRAWACPYPTWDPMINPRKERGYLGKVYLMDHSTPLPLEFSLKKFLIDAKRPSMLLEHVEKPFGGFQMMENRFEGLHITSQWILDISGKTAVLKVTAVNRNAQGKNIPVCLKVQSFPRIGSKFGPRFAPGILHVDGRTVSSELEANFILTRNGKKSGMSSARIPEYPWQNPGPVSISANPATHQEILTVTPDSKCAAFYTWRRDKEMTVEFLTEEIILKPGEQISYEFGFAYDMKTVRKK
ncbi:MAG: hypothetical protein MR727_10985 [Lentisphaeria bacterium]|nr:hypothetical protein [Lentisphaeria bacterium]